MSRLSLHAGKVFVAVVVAVLVTGVMLGATDPPALTDLERTKLELLQVRTAYAQLLAQHDACKAELGVAYQTLGALRASAASSALTAQEATLTREIEAAHPGYVLDPKTGVLTKKPADAK